MSQPTNNQEWEDEFCKKFTCPEPKIAIDLNGNVLLWGNLEDAKSFIRQEIRKAKIEYYHKGWQEGIEKCISEMKARRQEVKN